ncbi:MAG: UDP-N-acetylglucosamine 2-epimerase [Flavobacteriaceae bacterium]|nr:UDP-N-acetylglucosamine 2-epimerase [Flavobacteriaceae bacterium]
MYKKIVFLTGTRADFGKLKPLIQILQNRSDFEVHLFVTGMHLNPLYGYTLLEIQKSGFKNIHTFKNTTCETTMELTLAKTIEGFSSFIKQHQPDLIVVHGDRVEALAGAIVGSLNNRLVAHVEGGELSGTIDELIRHAVSKLSHLHFVSNEEAKMRLLQMGEIDDSIAVIGSPDVDVMFSNTLPNLETAKSYYEIPFENYAIALFHPITTEIEQMNVYVKEWVKGLIKTDKKYLLVYPNNDLGSSIILKEYEKLKGNSNFRILPSLRFEYFLTLLKNADFIIGNSSAGIREAPYYGVSTINIGSRQKNRVSHIVIQNIVCLSDQIVEAVEVLIGNNNREIVQPFGTGKSAKLFLSTILGNKTWNINHQKQFLDNS